MTGLAHCKFFSKCHADAVITLPATKMPLCSTHFIENIEQRVSRTLHTYSLVDMTDPKEKILVATSGGKDSQTLLKILHATLSPHVPLEALYIDVGIAPHQYTQDSCIKVQNFCQKLNTPLHIVNIKEEMGFDMDDIHHIGQKIHHRKSRSGSQIHFRGECSYCGLIKRYYINRFATLNNFTKVATGHNLTDEATQLVSNFFNLDMELMSRTGPVTTTDVDGLVPRIKPLYFIYEQEIMLYAYYAKVDHISTECEYAEDAPNVTLKKSLEHIESFRRATMMNMMLKYQKDLKPLFFRTIPAEKLIARRCTHCNMPTYLEVCAFCKTKERLLELIKESSSTLP